MARVKQSRRITLAVSAEQYERWEEWARHLKRPLPRFVVFVMDWTVRYLRERERGRKYPELDAIGLRLDQREKLRSLIEDLRDGLDKLAEALR